MHAPRVLRVHVPEIPGNSDIPGRSGEICEIYQASEISAQISEITQISEISQISA
jgi:hypothetical protein